MKPLLCFLVLIVTLGSSCKKNDNQAIKLSGTYAGTFQRKVSGSGAVSNVSLNFSDNAWNGESQTVKYPALSHGTFSTTGNKINFKNESALTAEFDWSLILSGDYDIALSGNKITISKSYATGMTDVYTLSKQ